MSLRRSAKSSASSVAIGLGLGPVMPPTDGFALAGDAASPTALNRLEAAVGALRLVAAEPLLQRALGELRADNPKAASEWALKALAHDERNGTGWYILAVAREKAGDFRSSMDAYEMALGLLPDETAVANDLGRLAFRLGMTDIAEALFRRHLQADPGCVEAANNLACALRDQRRFAEAIEVLRPAIVADAGQPILWNSLGAVLAEQGDMATALTFFEEALRLDPTFTRALYNRGNMLLALGHPAEALVDCNAALLSTKAPDERAMIKVARSTIRLCSGDIAGGWEDYEGRFDPHFNNVTHFLVHHPRWSPQADFSGKTLLVVGEQGLGDEVLFANLLPDVLKDLGPDGRLLLALEPRLVSLFQRSFPTAEVGDHATYNVDGRTVRGSAFIEAARDVDLWTPIGSLLRRFRPSLEDFPSQPGFLRADPDRVAAWRQRLATEAPVGRKVGILWKSLKLDGDRSRYYSPFEQWAPVLRTPGVSFVNIQYGDCSEELELARRELGVEIWQPPGIDLKMDLDELAALTCALDLTLGFSNATSNIAAACGAPTWMISAPAAWTRLGTERMPWYPQARVFLPEQYGDWAPVMAEVAKALSEG